MIGWMDLGRARALAAARSLEPAFNRSAAKRALCSASERLRVSYWFFCGRRFTLVTPLASNVTRILTLTARDSRNSLPTGGGISRDTQRSGRKVRDWPRHPICGQRSSSGMDFARERTRFVRKLITIIIIVIIIGVSLESVPSQP